MDTNINKILDNRYEIIELIGQGGMATVYKALDRKLGRMVAVKILKPEMREDSDYRRRFHAESEAVARLSHPNIINVFDVSARDDTDYFVMELIDGITLKQYMTQRVRLSPKEVIHFTVQILKGLEHAHAKNIVHRDVKPQNVMILRDGTVKVADFGIARMTESERATLTKDALGSVHYISPEQVRGAETDGRADIYAVGVMMYEMMTGVLPYQGESALAVAMKHVNSTPLPPRYQNTDIPPALEQITLKAMAADLSKRYKSAGEMIDDLERFRRAPAGFVMVNPPEIVPPGDTVRFAPPREAEQIAAPVITGAIEDRPAKTEQKQEKKRRFNLMPILAALLVLMLLSAVIAALWITILAPEASAGDVVVPKLVGRLYSDVLLDPDIRLDIVAAAEKYSSEYAAGYIIAQKVPQGKKVKEGGVVEVTISKGVHYEAMPNYRFSPVREAETGLKALMENDIVIKYQYEPSDTVDKDCVIRTDPIAGVTIAAGDTVIFYISSGEEVEYAIVPNLFNMTEAQARQTLNSVGLSIGEINRVKTDIVGPNLVYDQSTPASNRVPKGTRIDITINTPDGGTTSTTSESSSTESTTEPTTPPETTTTTTSFVWTYYFPQDASIPDYFFLEFYQDGMLIYEEGGVSKADGWRNITLVSRAPVEVWIDKSYYKTETP